MAKKIVTLYIDDKSIRLLVTRGNRIKTWADLALEPGLIEGAVVINEEEVAAKIKHLLKDQKVRTKKVIVGVSGLHCMTRPIILPQLPNTLVAEAAMRVAENTLPLSLDQLYITWRTIPAPLGKIQVFLTALRRKAGDAMVKTLKEAGLNPYIMDIKPLALARLVQEATAMVVDIQPNEFDIVIMVDGVPQPIRTVTFPREALSWEEKYPFILNDIQRTIQFYNSNNQEKPLAPTTPMFVSGESEYASQFCTALAKEMGYPVSPLASPIECPEELDKGRYMANIGLVLKEPSFKKSLGSSSANLNVLPFPYHPKPISLIKVAAIPAAIAIIGLIIPMWMLVNNASANIDSIRSQFNVTSELLKKKQTQKLEINKDITELGKKVTEAESARNMLVVALESIDVKHTLLNGDLDVIPSAAPLDIKITGIRHETEKVTINGISPNEMEVFAYIRNLDATGRFSEILISSMKKIEEEEDKIEIRFTLILKKGG